MVKPRVFVSSTYYDLKHIRNGLKSFIESFGYEAVLFEDGAIPYDHLLPLDQSCYSEVARCHMLVLIIGGRYGSPSSTTESGEGNESCGSCKSITVEEYQSARKIGIPTFVFIERNVNAEYQTFKINRDKPDFKYAYVDNKKVYEFIDQVYSQKIGNPVQPFEKFEDISDWLRCQWAGLFAEYLRQLREEKVLSSISNKIDELSQVSGALKAYTESLMKQVKPEGYDTLIESESKKIEDARHKRIFFESWFYNMIKELAKNYKLNLHDIDIYSKFNQTNDFNDFLLQLGFSNEDVNNLAAICIYNDEYADLKEKSNLDLGT